MGIKHYKQTDRRKEVRIKCYNSKQTDRPLKEVRYKRYRQTDIFLLTGGYGGYGWLRVIMGDSALKLKPQVTNIQTYNALALYIDHETHILLSPSSLTQISKRLKQTLLRNLIADTRRHKIDGEGLQRTENWCGRQKNQEWQNLNKFQDKNRRRK